MAQVPETQNLRVWTPGRFKKVWLKIHETGKNDKEGRRWASRASLSRGHKRELLPSYIPLVSSLLRISGPLKCFH
jgi:hypothetical protein